MGCAPMGHILYDEIMRYNPKNPYWFNRDCFVLSAGHGCMLQYALLHLAGYDSVQEDDLKNLEHQVILRILKHLELKLQLVCLLGQCIANVVGLALAEKHLVARFNKSNNEIVDHYMYAILGDGCQMEGIANEACSFARHCGLGMLIAFYDDNQISLDRDTKITFIENVDECFKGLGWHVIWSRMGILVTTTVGYGSPNKANSYNVHGSALGAMEVDATRKNLTWPHEPFHVPEDVKRHWSRHVQQGAALEKYKDEATELKLIITGELPARWDKHFHPANATRNLPQQNPNAFVKVLPGFLGGSADLASSNMTLLKMYGNFQKDTPEERNIRFGVREHEIGVICNSITYHSPDLIPYYATFFVFTDYMIAAIRMSALSQARVIYIMTHDSIESVLPSSVSSRLNIEAESTFGWNKIVGLKGKAIGIDWFGTSAPTGRLYKEFNLTPEVVVAAAKELC
ncbi:hypothetical protein ES332_D12G123300v1 [Gossypium tomentosum]|uniref:Transketolase-like pyrimidine-binding domain-containing protein n=1 Tax=Gossypium tomentosum TaxID=34277 RepID=A0A5D2I7R6_GOSTO|nr:hypothetical protein ES332_D12G123300v1 [Gossypium tomentosum]